MIQIVTGDPRPIFKQIVDSVRLQVATGELEPGSKLPSVRGLAMQLTVNTNTVAKAYNELTALGLVESRKGLGLFVTKPRQLLSREEQDKRLQIAIDQFVNDVIGLDFNSHDILQRIDKALEVINKDERKDEQ